LRHFHVDLNGPFHSSCIGQLGTAGTVTKGTKSTLPFLFCVPSPEEENRRFRVQMEFWVDCRGLESYLQVLLSYMVIYTVYATLENRKVAFHRVRAD
jgi:hypothetical protein